jgi:hypothetical protein
VARTALSVSDIPLGGINANQFEAANADGESVAIDNSNRTFVVVKNASGGPCTVTVQTPGTKDGLAVDETTVVVANGGTTAIPLRYAIHVQDDGAAYVDFSTVSSVTVCAFKVPA